MLKRVLLGWGIGRMGSRISTHFEIILKELNLKQTNDDGATVYWQQNQEPEGYSIYRIAPNESLKRDADELPFHEIANGIREVLKNQISLTKADLVKEAARLFGYARIGTNVEVAMLQGLRKALAKGFARTENERIVHND